MLSDNVVVTMNKEIITYYLMVSLIRYLVRLPPEIRLGLSSCWNLDFSAQCDWCIKDFANMQVSQYHVYHRCWCLGDAEIVICRVISRVVNDYHIEYGREGKIWQLRASVGD